ncbi:MAG TPA: MFS transporter [Solirubrobacteraceae bacterium]|nr:MFS transporter [Solirubrobacteraceae bacterium]
MRLPRLRPDLAPLRDSRDFRLVVIGSFLSGLGAQATLVALPYQVYVQTRSAVLVGLLGAIELVPLVAAALLGGAVADRVDRRRLLLLDQVGLALTAAGLAAAAGIGHPGIGVLYALAALLALEYGLGTLTMVVGPALGGLVISALGLTWAYAIDAISCAAMVIALLPGWPVPPALVSRSSRAACCA